MEVGMTYTKLSQVGQSLSLLRDKKIPFVLGMKLGRISKLIQDEVTEYQKTIQKVYEEFGKKTVDDKSGQTIIQIPMENRVEADDQIAKVNNTEVVLHFMAIVLDDVLEQKKSEEKDPTRALDVNFYALISPFMAGDVFDKLGAP